MIYKLYEALIQKYPKYEKFIVENLKSDNDSDFNLHIKIKHQNGDNFYVHANASDNVIQITYCDILFYYHVNTFPKDTNGVYDWNSVIKEIKENSKEENYANK
jgi:hypothetical protein